MNRDTLKSNAPRAAVLKHLPLAPTWTFAALPILVLATAFALVTPASAQTGDARQQALARYFGTLNVAAIQITATDNVFEDRVEIRWPSAVNPNVFWRVKRDNVLLTVLSSQDSFYADTSGTAGQVYSYCVTLHDATTKTELELDCDPGSRIIFAPTQMSASDGLFDNKVAVTWSDQSTIEAGYRLYRDGLPLADLQVNTDGFSDTTATPGQNHNYCVQAVDAVGQTSTQVCNAGMRAFSAPPPSVSASDGQYSGYVLVTWNAPASTAGFRLYRNGTQIAAPEDTSRSYQDATAVTGVTYTYCVTSLNAQNQESIQVCDTGGVGILAGPTNVAATDREFDSKVRVTWTDPGDTEDGFRVFREAPAQASALVGTFAANVTTFDDLDAVPDVLYRYCVVAFSNGGGVSDSVCAMGRRSPILAPTAVQATDGTHEDRVDITWESSATNVVLFNIYRDGTVIQTLPGTARSASDHNIATGASHQYCVRAVTALEVESAAACDGGHRALKPPTNLAAGDDANEAYVLVSWDDNSSFETGYVVERKLPADASYAIVDSVGLGHSAYLDTKGTPGLLYTYRVRVFDARGHSPSGPTDTGQRTLRAPGSLAATDGKFENKILLTWTPQSAAEIGYRIYRKTGPGAFAVKDTVPANTGAYEDLVGVVFGTTYTYKVVAYDKYGESQDAQDDGSTAMLAPGDVNASDTYTDKVTLTWVDRSNIETGYVVTRDGTTLTTTAANATSYTDNTAVAGTIYQYCVQATSATTQSDLVCDSGTRAVVVSGVAALLVPPATLPTNLETHGHGDAVAVNGGVAAFVSGTGVSGPDTVYVMERTNGNWSTTLTLAGGGDFGSAVDLDGERLIVGNGGSAQIYTRGAGGWSGPATITAGGANFGSRVAIAGDRALIGEWDGNGTNGKVYVYRLSSGSWTQEQVINSPGVSQFPSDVDLDGTRAIFSSQSATYIYKRTGTSWASEQTIGSWGATVGIDGATAVLTNLSGAYAYSLSGGTWTQTGAFPYGGGPKHAAVEGTFVIVGSTGGAAAVFEHQPAGWVQVQSIVPADGYGPSIYVDLEGGTGLMTAGTAFGAQKVYLFDVLSPPGVLTASDGQFAARVQLNWGDNSSNESGFHIYRDGALIDSTEANVRSYSDYDAEPGRVYEYSVAAFVTGGTESSRSSDFGRRPPNGSLTGRVATRAGAGVGGVEVCLDPAPASALLFDGIAGKAEVTGFETGSASFDQLTAEFWLKTKSTTGGTPFSYFKDATHQATVTLDPDGSLIVTINFTQLVVHSTQKVNDGQWHHVAVLWRNTDGLVLIKVDDASFQSLGTGVEVGNTIPTGATVTLGQFQGELDEVRMWRTTRNNNELVANRNRAVDPATDGLVLILPLDEGAGPATYDRAGHTEYARMSGGVFWADDIAPVQACAVTDSEGDYAMKELHYGAGTTFRVTPQLGVHQFDPAYKSITLNPGNPVQNEIAFHDISSFTLSGRVMLDSTTCAAAGVEILLDDVVFGTTGEDGRFAIASGLGSHTLKVRQGNRAFFPASRSIEIEADASGLDFVDKTVRTLKVVVGGGCNQPIGTVTFRARTEDDCDVETRSTASEIDLRLSPRKYQIEVTGVTGEPDALDLAEIIRFFQALGPLTVDLTQRDSTLHVTYRAPVVVEIAGFDPAPNCNLILPNNVSVPAVPVLQQGDRVPLTIRVYEDYGDGNHCPLDSTVVTIFDEILDEQDQPVEVTIRNGEGSYTTIANTPNVFAGRVDLQGNNRSYQKPLTVVAQVPGQSTVTATSWVLVTGHRPRAGTFTSTANEIPLRILRDPPGDGSSAFLEKGVTSCTEITKLFQEKFAQGLNVKLETGVKWQKGTPFLTTTTTLQTETEHKWRIGLEATQNSGLRVCTETLEKWSTPTDNSWIDGDGDLLMGIAVNLLFAKTDKLELQGCNLAKSEAITVGSDGFSSTYVYTVKHIRDVVIPQLEEIAGSDTTNLRNYYLSQAENWRKHLRFNDSLKTVATFKRNLSFSAGADYEFSSKVDTVRSFVWTVKAFTNAELAFGFDFEESGVGSFLQWATDISFDFTRSEASETDTATTVGYILKDDDAGDFFSVNVLDDTRYGTPVFKTVSGRSSCPVEATTQPRDGVQIRIEPPLQDGVEPGEVAHFVMSVTNTSQSDEEREYFIQPIQTSNPDGASIFLVGDTFLQLAVNLKPGQTHNWELTIVKGPSKFRYDDIKIMVMPSCQFDYWRKTGVMLQADTASFSVHFQAPCSDITLFQPEPGWTYNAADSLETGNKIQLTLADYQIEVAEHDSIEVIGAQYRLAETETWTTLGEVSRKDLDGSSVELQWNVASRPDGQYELRAFTRCAAGYTYSPTSTGRIDRKSPMAFGAPQPADSLLSLGEEIAITFDEDIDCDTATLENVTLEVNNPDATVEPIDISVACNGRTLILTPVDPAYPSLEGKKLRARVTGIQDLLGNPMAGPNLSTEVAWRTSVRRNVFTWRETNVSGQAPYRNPGSLNGTLVNGTSAPVSFNLATVVPAGSPVWLSAVPSSGTIASGDSLPVQLVISPTLTTVDPINVPKTYTATVNANVTSPAITSPLAVQVVIFCDKPDWVVNPGDFQYSMTVVALEQINGVNQIDNPNDKVAAFVGGQLRGVASPILVPALNSWLTFLTVYSNRATGENVRFQVFDDSDCRLYTGTNRTVRFDADKREGTTAAPVVLNTQDLPAGSVQQIAVNDGWTWISFNLLSPTDMTVNGVLGDLNAVAGDLVKSQTLFSQFDPVAGWAGVLGDFNNIESYALNVSGGGTIIHEGMPVPLSTTSIPVANGWNWIAYLPQLPLPINQTLSLLGPQNGDMVKSQTQFAQFVKSGSVSSWLGSLTTMNPGLGYRMFLSNASIIQNQFKYFAPAATPATLLPVAGGAVTPVSGRAGPSSAGPEVVAHATLQSLGPGWQVDARAYPFNMTITGTLESGGVTLSDDRFVVAAMMGDEVRGLAQPQYVEGVNRRLVFLMVYGKESESAPITFRVYDTVKGEVLDVDGSLAFAPDLVTGSIMEPFAFGVGSSHSGGSPLPLEFSLSQNVPNPPKGAVVIRFGLPTDQHVVLKVHDIAGREVMSLVDGDKPAGFHSVQLNASRLASGLYFYRMRAGEFTQARKMIVVN